MEKIKDFFYYIGDFLVCVLILSLMYFLITWKLDETMPINANEAEQVASENLHPEDIEPDKTENLDSSISESENSLDTDANSDTSSSMGDNPSEQSGDGNSNVNQNGDVDSENNTGAGDNDEVNPSENENSGTSSESNTDNTTSNNGESGAYTGGLTNNDPVNFTISMGMTGQDIANKLKEKGIIDSPSKFIKKLEEMQLSSSLLAGDFKLKQGMDYETVIKVLTGKK